MLAISIYGAMEEHIDGNNTNTVLNLRYAPLTSNDVSLDNIARIEEDQPAEDKLAPFLWDVVDGSGR